MEQLEGNRYVGIHIALGMKNDEKRPAIFEVIDGGPADRAGVQENDLLEKIDGVDTSGMTAQQAVDRLRGQEGTERDDHRTPTQSDDFADIHDHARSAPRGRPCSGSRKRPAGDWDCVLDASAPIAYLRINQIAASTPNDIRKLARQIESRGHCGIILDLRGVGGTSVHPGVLFADTLLAGGIIGRVRTADREATYQFELRRFAAQLKPSKFAFA